MTLIICQDFPNFPNSYAVHIEYNIENEDYTGSLFEIFDADDGRLLLNYFENGYVVTNYVFADLNGGSVYTVVDGVNCSVSVAGSEYVLDDAVVYFSQNDHIDEAIYTGKDTVRGIPCDFWTWSDSNHTHKYYFAEESWNISDTNGYRIPIRVHAQGEAIHGGLYNHYYEYTEYEVGPFPDSYFEIDPTLRCGSLINPSPPSLPTTFKMTLEANNIIESRTTLIREWLDPEKGLFYVRITNDDDDDVQYIFDRDNNRLITIEDDSNCTITVNDGSSIPTSVDSLMPFTDEYITNYDGTTFVRGIPAERWISINKETGLSVETYFSLEGWVLLGDHFPEERVLLRSVVKGYYTNTAGETLPVHVEHDIIGFHHLEEQDYLLFNLDSISQFYECKSSEQKAIPTLPTKFRTRIDVSSSNEQHNSLTDFLLWADRDLQQSSFLVKMPDDSVTWTFWNRGEGILYNVSLPNGWNGPSECNVIDNFNEEMNNAIEDDSNPWFSAYLLHDLSGFEYYGTKRVRNILADQWLTTKSWTSGNNTFDYTEIIYFPVQSWSFFENPNEINYPVRTTIKGDFLINGTKYPMTFEYDYYEFYTGQEAVTTNYLNPDPVFHCPSPIQKEFPGIPERFSSAIEMNHIDDRKTQYFDIWYDLVVGDYRVELGDHSLIEIDLGDLGLQYVYDGNTCSHYDIGENLVDYESLISIPELFSNLSGSTIYLGQSRIREIDCDVWSLDQEFTKDDLVGTYKLYYYFKTSETVDNILVRILVSGNLYDTVTLSTTIVSDEYDFISFNPGAFKEEVFMIPEEWGCSYSGSQSYPSADLSVFLFVTLKIPFNIDSTLDAISNQTRIPQDRMEVVGVWDANETSVVMIHMLFSSEARLLSATEELEVLEMFPPSHLGVSELQDFSFSRTAACPACDQGFCHFGQCLCYDGYIGSECDKRGGTTFHIDRSNPENYLFPMIIGWIIASLIGALFSFFTLKIFNRYDFKRRQEQ